MYMSEVLLSVIFAGVFEHHTGIGHHEGRALNPRASVRGG
jgi:hypothetical protein